MTIPPPDAPVLGTAGFDLSCWPVVRGRSPAGDLAMVEAWIDALTLILDSGQRFAVVMDMPGTITADAATLTEGRKKVILWMKQRREDLAARCGGFVYLPADPAELEDLAAKTAQVAAAFPFPLHVAPDEAAAFERARSLTH
ncbi:hypothetical protein [Tistrella mobilis]|uniref:hypothetical protein n=1 Tax=Tistrella mobilis TaxID=171437 RepID=UPI0035593670